MAKSAAWTRKAGKSPSGGLNEKGRKSYERQNPGSDLKAPQPEGGPRKRSFCARSAGQMKKFPEAAKDPNSRLRKARRKWKC
jgi:ribosomal protein S12